MTSFTEFGQVGLYLDLFFYLYVAWLGILFVRSASEWIYRAMWIGCIGPPVMNPLKMLIPRYASVVWWVELFMNVVAILASVAVFIKLREINSKPNTAPDSK